MLPRRCLRPITVVPKPDFGLISSSLYRENRRGTQPSPASTIIPPRLFAGSFLGPRPPTTSDKSSVLTKNTINRNYMTELSGGPVQDLIQAKLIAELEPLHLEIENESYKHSVPRGSESHFKVVVVSSKFEGLPLLKQHQLVNSILKDELAHKIHALAIKTATPEKWKANGGVLNLETPNCLGGSKHDPHFKK